MKLSFTYLLSPDDRSRLFHVIKVRDGFATASIYGKGDDLTESEVAQMTTKLEELEGVEITVS